jgi:hypothetical protein
MGKYKAPQNARLLNKQIQKPKQYGQEIRRVQKVSFFECKYSGKLLTLKVVLYSESSYLNSFK